MNIEDEIPFIDEANFVILCKKLYAIDLPTDGFTGAGKDMPDKWYADGDIHTMYVGQITKMMAR